MKPGYVVFAVLAALGSMLAGARAKADHPKLGETALIAYEGTQNWPKSDTAQVIKDYAVPIYIGLPNKRFKVLGRIYDKRTHGLDVVGRAFDEGLGKETHRMRDCANQAKRHGADAVVVTDDEKVLKAFNLTRKQLAESAPLFDHKDKIVLAVKVD